MKAGTFATILLNIVIMASILPAMMIPQVARRLIEMYGKDKEVLLDPFMGSGTALLEAKLHKNFKKAYGIDINPLALLISKVKTTPINPEILKGEYSKLISRCNADKKAVNFREKEITKQNFFNIGFWFKPQVIIDLAIIKQNIEKIENKDIKDFFLISFSETVRNVSNTRNREYKLYRMSQNMLEKHNPNTFEEFKSKASKSIIGKEEVLNIDKVSLGGIPTKDLHNGLGSPTLKKTLNEISKIDSRRAKDVLSFYVDFDKCVQELHRVTKKGAFLCFVVGNRTVKGVQIPTDEIILELFQAKNHYKHHNTFIRNIPHKRMPKINSPTNISGNHGVTMNEEWIVIIEKQ